MNFINKHIKWIMLISGAIAFSMILAVIAPQLVLRLMFGSGLEGALAGVIVRYWGVLISLIGVLLIYGAFKSEVRSLALFVAALSKIAFVTIVIVGGFGSQALLAVIFDSIMLVLYGSYLISNSRK